MIVWVGFFSLEERHSLLFECNSSLVPKAPLELFDPHNGPAYNLKFLSAWLTFIISRWLQTWRTNTTYSYDAYPGNNNFSRTTSSTLCFMIFHTHYTPVSRHYFGTKNRQAGPSNNGSIGKVWITASGYVKSLTFSIVPYQRWITMQPHLLSLLSKKKYYTNVNRAMDSCEES